jgi:hypothetical protein
MISPEDIVSGLSVSTGLETLIITFQPQGLRTNRHPRPPTRTVLTALNILMFKGADKYLQDFVARPST